MINIHEREKKQFFRLFKQQGVDKFDLRYKVLEAFLKLEHHVTAGDVAKQLDSDGIRLEESFVYNTMELLCRFGFATKHRFDDVQSCYEHHHIGLHHDHMVCTKCGKILEFRDESIEKQQFKVAEAYGFHMLQHKMEIYGICTQCMADRQPLVPLHKARQGERLIIQEFESGKNMQSRISSMGLKTGDMIEIVSSGFGGQVVIAAGENRLVLGKGMAEKVLVQSVEPGRIPGGDASLQKEPSTPAIPLSEMKTGQEGIIRKVSGESVFRRRLLEMGVNRGSSIYVEKYAPLRDPVELVIKGYHISLRVEEAARVMVENVRFRNN